MATTKVGMGRGEGVRDIERAWRDNKWGWGPYTAGNAEGKDIVEIRREILRGRCDDEVREGRNATEREVPWPGAKEYEMWGNGIKQRQNLTFQQPGPRWSRTCLRIATTCCLVFNQTAWVVKCTGGLVIHWQNGS
jgi:hypothetical protein